MSKEQRKINRKEKREKLRDARRNAIKYFEEYMSTFQTSKTSSIETIRNKQKEHLEAIEDVRSGKEDDLVLVWNKKNN